MAPQELAEARARWRRKSTRDQDCSTAERYRVYWEGGLSPAERSQLRVPPCATLYVLRQRTSGDVTRERPERKQITKGNLHSHAFHGELGKGHPSSAASCRAMTSRARLLCCANARWRHLPCMETRHIAWVSLCNGRIKITDDFYRKSLITGEFAAKEMSSVQSQAVPTSSGAEMSGHNRSRLRLGRVASAAGL